MWTKPNLGEKNAWMQSGKRKIHRPQGRHCWWACVLRLPGGWSTLAIWGSQLDAVLEVTSLEGGRYGGAATQGCHKPGMLQRQCQAGTSSPNSLPFTAQDFIGPAMGHLLVTPRALSEFTSMACACLDESSSFPNNDLEN